MFKNFFHWHTTYKSSKDLFTLKEMENANSSRPTNTVFVSSLATAVTMTAHRGYHCYDGWRLPRPCQPWSHYRSADTPQTTPCVSNNKDKSFIETDCTDWMKDGLKNTFSYKDFCMKM